MMLLLSVFHTGQLHHIFIAFALAANSCLAVRLGYTLISHLDARLQPQMAGVPGVTAVTRRGISTWI